MSETEKKTVRLRSSDGKIFEVKESVARVAKTLQDMLDEDCADAVIPITCAPVLTKVIHYCKEQTWTTIRTKQGREAWELKFMEGVDTSTLCELLVASKFLNIEGLLNLGVDKMVRCMIQGKYPQEIRDVFNIVNEFTPEEEEIRNQNASAFEGDPFYQKRSSSHVQNK